MADLNDVIAGAVEAATTEGTVPEAEGVAEVEVEAGTETPETPEVAVEAEGAPGDKPAKEEPPVDELVDGVPKDLAELGLKLDKGKDNRMPHSRVVKIWENAKKKLVDQHLAELKQRDDTIAQSNARIQRIKDLDALVSSDADRFMATLAAMHPQLYSKFLTKKEAEAEAVKTPPPANDPMPQPDVDYPDGSRGYSADGLAKLLDWNGRSVERQVTETVIKTVEARVGKRLEPIEQERKDAEALVAKQQAIQADLSEARETWGELLVKHDAELAAYAKANPKLSVTQVCNKVLVPKVQADRNTMRADLIKEINGRPAAAKKTPTAATKAVVDPDAPRALVDVISEAVAASGLK